jgi:hypothetical protein
MGSVDPVVHHIYTLVRPPLWLGKCNVSIAHYTGHGIRVIIIPSIFRSSTNGPQYSLLQKPFVVSVNNLFSVLASLADTIYTIPKIAYFSYRMFPADTKNRFSKKNSQARHRPTGPNPGHADTPTRCYHRAGRRPSLRLEPCPSPLARRGPSRVQQRPPSRLRAGEGRRRGCTQEKARGPAACPAACLIKLCGCSSPPRRHSHAALRRRAPWPCASSVPRVLWPLPPPPPVCRGHRLLRLIVFHGRRLYINKES